MKDNFRAGIIAGSMVGAIAGVMAYKRMSPLQKRALNKNVNHAVDQVTDVLSTIQKSSPFK